jgi:hypothetical protein
MPLSCSCLLDLWLICFWYDCSVVWSDCRPIYVGGAEEHNGGEGEAAFQPSRDAYQACQGGARASADQEAQPKDDKGGSGVLPVPQPPAGASALHGGAPRHTARSLLARLVGTGARLVLLVIIVEWCLQDICLDVISRLDTLRGKGMAANYSWSCKRYEHMNRLNCRLKIHLSIQHCIDDATMHAGDTRMGLCGTIWLRVICCCPHKAPSTFLRAPSCNSTSQIHRCHCHYQVFIPVIVINCILFLEHHHLLRCRCCFRPSAK